MKKKKISTNYDKVSVKDWCFGPLDIFLFYSVFCKKKKKIVWLYCPDYLLKLITAWSVSTLQDCDNCSAAVIMHDIS